MPDYDIAHDIRPLTVEGIREDLARTCDAGEMRMVDALIATFVLQLDSVTRSTPAAREAPTEEWYAVYCEGKPCAAYPRKIQAETYASQFAKPTEVRQLAAHPTEGTP